MKTSIIPRKKYAGQQKCLTMGVAGRTKQEEWVEGEGVGTFPFRHSPGHDLLFTRDARNSLCLLGDGQKTGPGWVGGNVSLQLVNFYLFPFLFFFISAADAASSPCLSFLLPLRQHLFVCWFVWLACRWWHNTKTQNLKDKANRSNSSNNRSNNSSNSSNINKQLWKNSSNINESSSKSLTKTFCS